MGFCHLDAANGKGTGRKGILCRAVQASWKHTFAALWRYAWGNAGGILEKSFLADMSLRWLEMI